MQQRHIDRYSYFNELAITSRDFYIDYLEKFVAIKRGLNILEIGCGEGGNLLPFAEKECNVTGIDRSEERISQAISYFKLLGFNGRFIYSDFFDFSSEEDMNKYDIILIHENRSSLFVFRGNYIISGTISCVHKNPYNESL